MVSQRQALHVTSVRPRVCFVLAAKPPGQSHSHSLGRIVKTGACASPEVWTSATQSAGPYCPWPRVSEARLDDIRADSSASSAQWGSPATTRGLFTSLLSMFGVAEVSSVMNAVATFLSELTWNIC